MVFGRKKSSGDEMIRRGIAMMIESFEDLERRLIHLSKPSAGFDADLWPPNGVNQQLSMVTETLAILGGTAAKHAAGTIAPQLVGELMGNAQTIGNTAQSFIEDRVHHAVAQHALRKAEKDARGS
jgi:hypothetical protein